MLFIMIFLSEPFFRYTTKHYCWIRFRDGKGSVILDSAASTASPRSVNGLLWQDLEFQLPRGDAVPFAESQECKIQNCRSGEAVNKLGEYRLPVGG
jgi:hypothetical protein